MQISLDVHVLNLSDITSKFYIITIFTIAEVQTMIRHADHVAPSLRKSWH
jgi:hypothetical protein